MRLTIQAIYGAAIFAGIAGAQPAKPAFEIADVHASAPFKNATMQGGVLRNGRYEIRRATMLDLIRSAYGVSPDTVVGGPAWLAWDRFDVIAKAPPSAPAETVRLMLQGLLADRFKLIVHKDTQPIEGFVLSQGKGKPKMKTASASSEPGCQVQPPQPPMNLVSCRGVTMTEFALWLRFANGYITGPVLDSTGLTGAWDFELSWSPRGMQSGVTLFEAIDKQLGLKLEAGKAPMPVLVVDSAMETPTPNLPEVRTALPPAPAIEFEVASVRLSPPDASLGGPPQVQPGGRFEARAYPLFLMIRQAWDSNTLPGENVPGTPKWLTLYEPLVNIIGKVPESVIADGGRIYDDDFQTLMRGLLTDRFNMKVHYEDRPMDAYTLVAVKPKLKLADPSNRSGCKVGPSPAPREIGAGPPPFVASCQNITMAQFVERLPSIAPAYFRFAVADGTRIEGAWDFAVSFMPGNPNAGGGGGGRSGGPAPARAEGVIDPTGGISIFDAVEKQLGLKLEVHKQPEPVLVIDHIDEKPTEN
jgi:uncharacterized protein (TIGR03435 family)